MNLGNLKRKIANYFDKTPTDFQRPDEGGDMILDALDSARLNAETIFPFEANRKVLTITVDGTGGADWTNLPEYQLINTTWRVRSLRSMYRLYGTPPACWCEVMFEFKSNLRFPTPIPLGSHDFSPPPWNGFDFNPSLPPGIWERMFIVGQRVYHYPINTDQIPMLVDAVVWMDDYVDKDASYSDWMIDKGYNYLFWYALDELNFYQKEWVPREEGNISIMKGKIESELAKLISLDANVQNGMASIIHVD